MAQKHLKELLEEDQEPFYLKDYIEDKKCMLIKKQAPKTQIQVKKQKQNFTKSACFFSKIQDSPDLSLRKSPLFDFTNSSSSPIISKKSPNNKVFLHVPAKTASLLLDAAMRIQQKPKINKHKKNLSSSSYSYSTSFGLFGSMLKRLTLRHRTNKLKDTSMNNVEKYNNATTFVSNNVATKSVSSISCSSSSCNNTRSSSLDLESSSSGRSFDHHHHHDNNNHDDDYNDDDYDDDCDDGFEFANVLRDVNDDGDYGAFCFANKSPVSNTFQDNQNYKQETSEKCQSVEEDEEDKEQNSPVSVLDPPFEDDYDGHDDDDDSYDQQCSFAFVQRAKQQLLHKLQRFEKLAELDPFELEKRLIEDEEEERVVKQSNEVDEYDFESFTFFNQEHSNELLDNVIAVSDFRDIKKPGIKRLISDLITEEETAENVCKRLETWKEVECNTIEMMVGIDLKREIGDWKKHQNEISETAIDIEVGIFAVLVKELVMELCC